MGYRSEIVAGVPIKDKKEALSIINDWDEIGESKEDKFFYMKADYWKWYNEYPDVSRFEEFILADDKRFLTGLGEDGAHHTNYGDSYKHDIYVVSCLEIENPSIKWRTKRAYKV
tara:strand:- start:54 stop:395 length:342 start_codon:yes stop_codon:yes gene_type:complete